MDKLQSIESVREENIQNKHEEAVTQNDKLMRNKSAKKEREKVF